jgi:hypothetical protein
MIRYLRIAILPLVAVVMPISYGMAEDIGTLPPVSANRAAPRLIRIVDQDCRRTCDTDFASCLAQAQEMRRSSVSNEQVNKSAEYAEACTQIHKYCYRGC